MLSRKEVKLDTAACNLHYLGNQGMITNSGVPRSTLEFKNTLNTSLKIKSLQGG